MTGDTDEHSQIKEKERSNPPASGPPFGLHLTEAESLGTGWSFMSDLHNLGKTLFWGHN